MEKSWTSRSENDRQPGSGRERRKQPGQEPHGDFVTYRRHKKAAEPNNTPSPHAPNAFINQRSQGITYLFGTVRISCVIPIIWLAEQLELLSLPSWLLAYTM